MKKRIFEIRYNDGVFAETIKFNNSFTNEAIEKTLLNFIKEFNKNPNKDYHITRKNIIEVI